MIQRAVVQFGAVPDLSALAKQLGMSLADVQNSLGSGVSQLAKENTDAGLSTEARLGVANTDAISRIKSELNKRGILNSGEAGYQLDRQNTGYRQAESDATNKLLDYLNQYQQGYLTAQQQREGTLSQAYSSAADRQFQNNQGSKGVTAGLDHIDANGRPVYKGPDGKFYNGDGSAYAPPGPQAPNNNGQYNGPDYSPPAAPARGTDITARLA
jgi:hypothetical protein